MNKDTSNVSDKFRTIIRLLGVSSKDVFPTPKEIEVYWALSESHEEWVLQESVNGILESRSIAALNRHVKNLIVKGFLVRVRDGANSKYMRYKAISQDELKVILNKISDQIGNKSTISISRLLGPFDPSEQEFVKNFFVEHIVNGFQLFSEEQPEIFKVADKNWIEKAQLMCELRAEILRPEGSHVDSIRMTNSYLFDILDLFDKYGEMTLGEVSQKLKKDWAFATQYLNQLRKMGYLKRYKNENLYTYYLFSQEV
ncbi:TPA: hypothetical protein I7730_00695 [Vibrio vulnificus]|uniref:Uncharacterized protein n=1 Tax=Vibrio vulnificus TaxID=672 RepID=A0A8H9MVE5_VIBVL|nr:hypothetical protein [Vibrio vulnificus]HAS8538317.1 hypothetical protein [Vibrio vulnificus]